MILLSSSSFLELQKMRGYFDLLKIRLSLLVTFSSAFGYILAHNGNIDWLNFTGFLIGGFLISGSAVTINQILEVDYDRLMSRTQNRPLPLGKLTLREAWIYAMILIVIASILILFFSNSLTLCLALISTVLYAFVYTPLKRYGPIAVFVGAVPGALPPLIGWVAANGNISVAAMIIFSIQFIWQFPHFWAIAWVADDDYKKAGFKLLPSGGKKDLNTAINIMIYTLFLLPLGLLPTYFRLTGLDSGIIATVCGVLFLSQTFMLMKDNSKKSAFKIMLGSFIYLPIVQIAYLFDKL